MTKLNLTIINKIINKYQQELNDNSLFRPISRVLYTGLMLNLNAQTIIQDSVLVPTNITGLKAVRFDENRLNNAAKQLCNQNPQAKATLETAMNILDDQFENLINHTFRLLVDNPDTLTPSRDALITNFNKTIADNTKEIVNGFKREGLILQDQTNPKQNYYVIDLVKNTELIY